MTLKMVMDKIDDGYWEAMEDVKVGKHVTIRDTKTNKRFSVYITEDLDNSEQLPLDEEVKAPLTLKIGDTVKTNEGTLKITDISISSLHINPITYITYKYDVALDGKNVKGEEKASLKSFMDHFKK